MPQHEGACPGRCNATYRRAWSDHDDAMEAWRAAEADYHQAYEAWAADPDTHDEPTRPEPPAEPDTACTLGDPVWCPRDAAAIRAALADLDDLAALLETWNDGHRGATSGEKISVHRTDAPSPSPITDTLDELYGALTKVEDDWRSARGYLPRPQRGRGGHARTSSVAWLLGQLDDILRHPGSVQFGHAAISWQRRLQHLTRSEPLVRRRPGSCIRCDERALRTRPDGYTQCAQCGLLYGEDEYQENVVEAQDGPTRAEAS